MYVYTQRKGGEETWKAIPASKKQEFVQEHAPAFTTVLAVSKLVEDLEPEERSKLSYSGPLYIDWDISTAAPDLSYVIPKFHEMLLKLQGMGLDLAACEIYATGGKGFHLEVPPECFMEKIPKDGMVPNLPTIYREFVFDNYVDTVDMRVYSEGRGRMWRTPNVQRENGHYKVPLTVQEAFSITPESYTALTAEPRPMIERVKPRLCLDMSIAYSSAAQKVAERMKTRAKRKKDPKAKERANVTSVQMMMDGYGVKEGIGFHQLSLQITIAANTAGLSEEEMLAQCEGIINSHESDGNRYNTPTKRREELRRMYHYTKDNPCYEFSIGAIKTLLCHEAADLDGIPITPDDVRESVNDMIAQAAAAADSGETTEELDIDEYGDVASGVTLSKYGVYIDTDQGKRRATAVSFKDIHLLISMSTGQLSAYEAMILVNGKPMGRQTIELETFQTTMQFNRFCARLGHAFNGTDAQVRGLMMRFVEAAKRKGKQLYIARREGLDVVSIPFHEDEELRKPFMVWADGRGVMLDPVVAGKELDVSFQGFPDPRGLFQSDLADAPKLSDWIKEDDNKEKMRNLLQNMLTCQKPEVIAKMLGWYTACIYRMIFHRAYGQFPALHVNGPAGSGKCLRKGTPVLLADGRTVAVEDVQVGDRLLGPDGSARKVLSLGRGRSKMWQVMPVKGDPYYVNDAHILSLRRSFVGGAYLSDGTCVAPEQDILNVNVRVWAESSPSIQKLFKGYRAEAVDFPEAPQAVRSIPAYILGLWLGDGDWEHPILTKPAHTQAVKAWKEYAESIGYGVTRHESAGQCPRWAITQGRGSWKNEVTVELQRLGLVGNKHIPASYLTAPKAERLQLLAGLLDSDGHATGGGYDWISKDRALAEGFVFLCRSLGLAAYLKPCVKGIKASNFQGGYFRVSVSGDCSVIPCKDKPAHPRKQVKNWLHTGLTCSELGEEDYYGFEIDGDHLFLLGDFTVTHNTSMQLAFMKLFYYNQTPISQSPSSTVFALQQHMAASASIPLLIDEYKPHEMGVELHNRLKLMFRDAYNCRDVLKGGGTRESDDYRALHHTQLSAPFLFVAEAAEEEAAVAERVVLVTLTKPAASVHMKWLGRFHQLQRNSSMLAILGQYLAAQAISSGGVEQLRSEFDPLYAKARDRFMLTEADIANTDMPDHEMRNKQGAKERTVYNFTVAAYGLGKFRDLVGAIYGADFDEIFDELESTIYQRMSDLQNATQAEWAKVMSMLSFLTYDADKDQPYSLVHAQDYAQTMVGSTDAIEISLQAAYMKYRTYCRSANVRPLYAGHQQFLMAMRDCPALLHYGQGSVLQRPGVYVLDTAELLKFGVDPFNDE